MKKLSLLFLCLILLLCSCSREPAPIVKFFTGTVTANCNGEKIKAQIHSDNQKLLNITITFPQSMKGCSYTYTAGNLKTKYKNLVADTTTDYLPSKAFPSIIYNTLSSLNRENNCHLISTTEATVTYSGTSDSGKYTLTTEFRTGALKSIEIKSIDFKAEFQKVKILS